MNIIFKLGFYAAVIASFASSSFAQQPTRYLVAKCKINQACDATVCVDAFMTPLNPIFILKKEDIFYAASVFGDPWHEIKHFPSSETARQSYETNANSNPPYFIVPTEQVDNGHGYDLHTVFHWRDEAYHFDRFIKLSCEFMHPGADFY